MTYKQLAGLLFSGAIILCLWSCSTINQEVALKEAAMNQSVTLAAEANAASQRADRVMAQLASCEDSMEWSEAARIQCYASIGRIIATATACFGPTATPYDTETPEPTIATPTVIPTYTNTPSPSPTPSPTLTPSPTPASWKCLLCTYSGQCGEGLWCKMNCLGFEADPEGYGRCVGYACPTCDCEYCRNLFLSQLSLAGGSND